MSYELTSRGHPGILSAIKGIVSGLLRTERPQYAHPWTAYSPANFQRSNTTDVASVTSNTVQSGTVSPIQTENAENASTSLQIARTSTAARPLQADATEDAKPTAKPVTLRLVSRTELAEASAKPVLPGLAASTGRDFQLAARLARVSALNRKVAPVAASSPVKSTGLNRPVKQAVIAKRSRNIEPPAVRRKTRSSAKIVQLRLPLARAEHKQVRTLKTA
jgi:hypothetical protein